MRANEDLRAYAKERGIKQWRIAEAYGMHESAYCVKLRHELPEFEKEHLRKIIDKLAEES